MDGQSAIEIILANLPLLSPSEVLNHSQASDTFKTFFERSSLNECNRLLPQGWCLTIKSTEGSRPQSKRPREGPDGISEAATRTGPQIALRDGSLEPMLYNSRLGTFADDDFETEVTSSPANVTKALKALRTNAIGPECCGIWSARGEIFGSAEDSPCRRLAQGQDKFNKEGMINECVSRFIFLFVSHEIDARTHGRRTSAAVELYAKETGQSLKDVKSQLRNSAKYEELLLKIGPGILLILGDSVRTLWEFRITYKDFECFLIELKTHHRHFHDLAMQLNGIGVRFALEGLKAYHGSTFGNLSSVESRLRIGLFRHCSRSVTLPWNNPGRDPRQVEKDQRREKRRRQHVNRRQKLAKVSAHSDAMPPREHADDNGHLIPYDTGLATSTLYTPLNQDPELTDNAQWNGQALDNESLTNLAENTNDWPGLIHFANDFPVFPLTESDLLNIETAFLPQ